MGGVLGGRTELTRRDVGTELTRRRPFQGCFVNVNTGFGIIVVNTCAKSGVKTWPTPGPHVVLIRVNTVLNMPPSRSRVCAVSAQNSRAGNLILWLSALILDPK